MSDGTKELPIGSSFFCKKLSGLEQQMDYL